MRAVWRYPVLALVALGVVGFPNAARAQNKAAAHSDEDNNFFELNFYGGYSDYQRLPQGLGGKIQPGVILGGRVTENFWNYIGIEEDFNAYSWNKYNFLSNPSNGINIANQPFPIHTLQPAIDIVAHFTPRDHKFRPFVAIGPGASFDVLGKNANKWGNSYPPGSGFEAFKTDERFQGNYGGGIKYQANKWFGIRLDVRGLVGIAPRFGLPTDNPGGGVYIPKGQILNGIQASAGLTLYLGHRGELPAPPAPPPPPPPPPPLQAINPGSINANPASVCPGDAVTLSSNASDPAGHTLTYQWSANGSAIGSGASYTYMPSLSGDLRIGLHVADSTDPARAGDASPVTVHVNTYNRPTVSVAANPTELDRGQMAMLRAVGMGSECSGTLRYSWAASEGTVSGTGTDATFDSTSVSFNDADRSRPQSKQVTVTATVTDAKGGSASATANITVNLGAEARHFGDIIFPKNSARVNNCGKRVLIEQLYPMLASNPNYDVVLVGHIGEGETPRLGRGRQARGLDRERVLNTAGVLSGGSGTCSSLDTSRIKGSWIGATQESPTVPTSCAVSTTAPKERRGQAVEDTDTAKNRRVEIWLVPKGLAAPASTHNPSDLPAADLKRVGCPK